MAAILPQGGFAAASLSKTPKQAHCELWCLPTKTPSVFANENRLHFPRPFPSHILGKNTRREIEFAHANQTLQRLMFTTQVLSRLSTPYLTEAEEHRHAQLRKAEQCREWREQVQRRRAGIKNITITPFPELQSSS